MQSSDEHDDLGLPAAEPTPVASARGRAGLSRLTGYAPSVALPVGFLTHVSPLLLIAIGLLTPAAAVTAEWQRRRTLVAVLRNAPEGSVVEQDGGAAGPFMRIRIGASSSRRRG